MRTLEEAAATYEQYALDAKQEKLSETYSYYTQLAAWLRELKERRKADSCEGRANEDARISTNRKGEPMLTIDKTKVDEIIDGLLGNNDLTASPEVWYRLHQIKNISAMEIIRCNECAFCRQFLSDKVCSLGLLHNINTDMDFCSRAVRKPERRTDD